MTHIGQRSSLAHHHIIYGAPTLSIMTFSITALSLNGLFAIPSVTTLGIKTLSITKHRHYAECRNVECHSLFIVLLNIIMRSVMVPNLQL